MIDDIFNFTPHKYFELLKRLKEFEASREEKNGEKEEQEFDDFGIEIL